MLVLCMVSEISHIIALGNFLLDSCMSIGSSCLSFLSYVYRLAERVVSSVPLYNSVL